MSGSSPPPPPVEVVVAAGCTVYRGGGSAGFGPGQTALLPADHAAALLANGHVTSPGTSGS